jgi:hypothetical protein
VRTFDTILYEAPAEHVVVRSTTMMIRPRDIIIAGHDAELVDPVVA